MLAAMTTSNPERGRTAALARSDGLRFVQLAESGIVGICVGNVYGDLLEANDFFLNLIGFSRREFDAGRVRWPERTPPEWAEAHHSAQDSLKRDGVAAPWKAELLHKNGHRVSVLMGIGTLDYPNTVTLVTNLTSPSAGHDRLRRTEERLRVQFHGQPIHLLVTDVSLPHGPPPQRAGKSRIDSVKCAGSSRCSTRPNTRRAPSSAMG